jgi:hypothetical protein
LDFDVAPDSGVSPEVDSVVGFFDFLDFFFVFAFVSVWVVCEDEDCVVIVVGVLDFFPVVCD